MRSRRVRLEVESLEGRIALSHPAALPDAAPAGRHAVAPEKREMLVTVKVTLPPGYGWFLEVRGGRGWNWKGPFADPARARSAFRRKGVRVRSSQLVLPPPPPEQFEMLPPDPSPGYESGEEPTQPEYLDGFEVEYLNPYGFWTKGVQREIFTNSWDASQRVYERNSQYYPILHRYVPVSLPADQWYVFGNRIYPLF
jgi:hypothetical protein